jgi:hypothetical protein
VRRSSRARASPPRSGIARRAAATRPAARRRIILAQTKKDSRCPTRFTPARQRLQRSELAVPASNPTMIDKAADSAADYVFLDLEDAVAPPEKEQARKNAIQALNDIDWAARARPCRCGSTGSTPITCTATWST